MQLELVYMCVIFSGFLSAPHVLYSVPHWRTTSSPLLYLLIRSSGYKHAAVSCRQQRDELNIINRGETKKKIIIINNKKIYTYFIPHVLYVRGSDVETRNHDENIVISLYNLTIFSPPLLVQHIWRSETSRIWKYYTYAWVSGIAAHHSCILTR